MALYRFLFAPVLLAVAVVAGSGQRAAVARPEAIVVPAARPVPTSFEKASAAAKPAGQAGPRVERAAAHPAP
jgi:hypothetical protein